MINFLHSNLPSPALLSTPILTIYWYGLFIVLGIIISLSVALFLAKKIDQSQNKIFDMTFWVIIFGIIGARIYHIFLEFNYYLKNPLEMFKIWEGGLAIHGAIIAGLITVFLFTKKYKMNFWRTLAIITPGIALGQAIGRFGNYFNQELFGKPTDLPWGIPISLMKRPHIYIGNEYFHPTFIYESLGNIAIFIILILILKNILEKKNNKFEYITISYLIMYSILRFSLEFIRIDQTPVMFGFRFPQIISIVIIVLSILFIFWTRKKGARINKAPLTTTTTENKVNT